MSKFDTMNEYQINYSIADIAATLYLWRDAEAGNAYVAKLYLELDAAQAALAAARKGVR